MSKWILVSLFYLNIVSVPVLTVWGWRRWATRKQPRTLTSDLSVISFGLATLSALLAIAAVLRGGFRYYDSLLLTIYGAGLLLALAGMVFAISGIWKPGPLRWHAPVCSLAMLAFWLIAAASE